MKPLTKEQLLANGECCGNGCVNCPYPYKVVYDLCTENIEKLLKEEYYNLRNTTNLPKNEN